MSFTTKCTKKLKSISGFAFSLPRSIPRLDSINTLWPMMIPKHDVREMICCFCWDEEIFFDGLGYPVTCLKFYANKDDLKSDQNRMIAATCTSNIEWRGENERKGMISYRSRHGWLCQNLALSNSTMCLHIRWKRTTAINAGFQLHLQSSLCSR